MENVKFLREMTVNKFGHMPTTQYAHLLHFTALVKIILSQPKATKLDLLYAINSAYERMFALTERRYSTDRRHIEKSGSILDTRIFK